jgi:hypothetical protein
LTPTSSKSNPALVPFFALRSRWLAALIAEVGSVTVKRGVLGVRSEAISEHFCGFSGRTNRGG